MRADRLLSLMLLLQANGQMTAGQLALELHVSERTIYRDIEALSFAGIPVYTQDGRGGGIALEENYRVSLTGLNKSEIQALFVSGMGSPVHDLGLAQSSETTLLKLLAALPSLHRAEAERVRQRIHIDPHDWFTTRHPSRFLPVIQEAVLGETVLNIHYLRANGESFERDIEAYGMVAKSSVWYLIGAHEGNFRTYRLSRLLDVQATTIRFNRDLDFNLVDYWQANTRAFVDSLPQYPVQLAVSADYRRELTQHPLFSGCEFTVTDDPDWFAFSVMFDTPEQAVMALLSIARHIRVLDPPELKERLLVYARETLAWLESTAHND